MVFFYNVVLIIMVPTVVVAVIVAAVVIVQACKFIFVSLLLVILSLGYGVGDAT